MSEKEEKKQGSYFGDAPLGASYGVAEKLPAFMGLDRAINWGAPVVELGGLAGQSGKSAREAIRTLADENKVELTWHAPVESGVFEFGIPDPKKNEEAKKHWETGIQFCKETGAKLIVMHPGGTMMQSLPEEYAYVYDNSSKQMQPIRIPERYIREAKEKGLDPRNYFIDKYNEINRRKLETSITENEYQLKLLKNVQNEIKKVVSDDFITLWNQTDSPEMRTLLYKNLNLSPETRMRIPVSLNPERKISEEELRKIKEQYELMKRNTELMEENLEDIKKDYSEFVGENAKPIIEEGIKKYKEHFAKTFAPVAAETVKKGIKIGLENSDSRFIIENPGDVNDIVQQLYKELEKPEYGLTKEQIRNMIGVTFDMGHAASSYGLEYTDPLTGEKKKIGTPDQYLKELKVPVIHVHAHENYGDSDAHLPLGEVENEVFNQKVRENIKKFLKERGFKGKVITETFVSGQGGPGYAISLEAINPDNYLVGGVDIRNVWGPTYLTANPTEGLFFPGEKENHYFYGSWIGGVI